MSCTLAKRYGGVERQGFEFQSKRCVKIRLNIVVRTVNGTIEVERKDISAYSCLCLISMLIIITIIISERPEWCIQHNEPSNLTRHAKSIFPNLGLSAPLTAVVAPAQ
jgi:hypothetical protein